MYKLSWPRSGRPPWRRVDGPEEPLGIYGVDQIHMTHHLLDLVGLQVADKMDLGADVDKGKNIR